MRYIDFLFYSYYCHFERRNKRFPKIFWGDSRADALTIIYFSIAGPLTLCYCLIDDFIVPLQDIPKFNTIEGLLYGLLIGIPTIGPLIYRYYHNKKIHKSNFKVFREKWGEDPRVHTKGRVAVIAYTIITRLMPFVLPFIIHPMFGK